MITNSIYRGSGQTYRQLLGLPSGACFVVAHEPMARYTRQMAKDFKRDIVVMTVEQMVLQRWQGRNFTAVALDHSVVLDNYIEIQAHEALLTRVR